MAQFRKLESGGVETDVVDNRKFFCCHQPRLVLLRTFNPAMQSMPELTLVAKLTNVQKLTSNRHLPSSAADSCLTGRIDGTLQILKNLTALTNRTFGLGHPFTLDYLSNLATAVS